VLVLDLWGFCAEKRADLLGNYFVPLVWRWDVRILEDDDEHENEDDFSTSEFSLAREDGLCAVPFFPLLGEPND